LRSKLRGIRPEEIEAGEHEFNANKTILHLDEASGDLEYVRQRDSSGEFEREVEEAERKLREVGKRAKKLEDSAE
jgi:uncharacterized protein YeeX (DUF496 family)